MGALSIKTEEEGTCSRIKKIEHREFVPEIGELGKFWNSFNREESSKLTFNGPVSVTGLGL